MVFGIERIPPRLVLAGLGVAAAAWAGCGGDAENAPPPGDPGPYGPGHALVRLICEETMITPGRPLTLGVTFDIEPGWYLYWNGLNDTGYPIQVQPEFPEGYEAGELQWPAPERHVSPGDILDHIYPERVTLLLPVSVPETAEPWTSVTLSCRVEWLACKEVCVPGQSIASLTLPVIGDSGNDLDTQHRKAAENARSEETARRFAETRSRLPVPLPENGSPVRWRWADSALVLDGGAVKRMSFYPYPDSAPLESILRDGVAESGPLTLTLSEEARPDQTVSGVLEVLPDASTPSLFYSIQIPLSDSE